MTSKVHTSGQKPRRRQLNAAVMKVPFFVFFRFLVTTTCVQQRYLANGLSTHRQCRTKLMVVTARSSTAIQRLHSSPWSIKAILNTLWLLSVVKGRHFLILCACAQVVSFPGQIRRSLVVPYLFEFYVRLKNN